MTGSAVAIGQKHRILLRAYDRHLFVFLCNSAKLLREFSVPIHFLPEMVITGPLNACFLPAKYLMFSVHVPDGQQVGSQIRDSKHPILFKV